MPTLYTIPHSLSSFDYFSQSIYTSEDFKNIVKALFSFYIQMKRTIRSIPLQNLQ